MKGEKNIPQVYFPKKVGYFMKLRHIASRWYIGVFCSKQIKFSKADTDYDLFSPKVCFVDGSIILLKT